MKSATRHVLLLAGMLCLWASAYSLGRSHPPEQAAPDGRNLPVIDGNAQARRVLPARDTPGTGIAASVTGVDLITRLEAPVSRAGSGGRTHGRSAPPSSPPRSRAGSG